MAQKLTKTTKANIKTLVVSYNGYYDAVNRSDDNGIIVWGSKILVMQEELGIVLIDANSLAARVKRARAREDEKRSLQSV
jgi:hypothetical protein